MSIRLIRSLRQISSQDKGCVATIGNFDGVHLGHQALLTSMKSAAARYALPSLAIVFEPQPNEYFQAKPPVRLSRLGEKLCFFAEAKVDRVLSIRFNAAFAAQSAKAFIEQVLVQQLGVKHLTVGYDFRFGQGRAGDVDLLKNRGLALGFEVNSIAEQAYQGAAVSSTVIRQCLARGDLSGAQQRLGRPYTLCGRVMHGDKRGRQLGFPTANIALHRDKPPLTGVYAVSVSGPNLLSEPAVANIGYRPTVGGRRALLEVHLLDFEANLYGQRLEVQFLHKIRDEQRFADLSALRQQIQSDTGSAQAFFENR